MKSEDPLLAAWEKTLRENNDQPAVLEHTGKMAATYRDIEERARRFETTIRGFHASDVIGVQLGNHPDWPSVLIACLRRQLVVLPLEESIADDQRDAALKVCKASALVTTGRPGEVPQIRRRRLEQAAPDWWDNRPALLKLTSGTTATPRAVRFRSKQLLADCNQICETMGITDDDLNFGVIPISHSYGFSNLLTPLIARGVATVLSFERTPRAVLLDLERTKATVFPGTPIFYQTFGAIGDGPPLPNLRLCISAGAALPASIAQKFREKFQLPVHSFYGASECGGICYDRAALNDTDGFVGQPMKGVDLEIIEPTKHASQIRVCSAAVGDGYFPEADTDQLADGAFVPDDLLSREQGGFRIIARASDVINVAGKKVNPVEVEAQLLRFPGVRQAVVFGRSTAFGALRNEQVTACVVTETEVRRAELEEFCRNALSAWQVPKQIFFVERIPANERGKISRRELARRFGTESHD